jgi:uncharacterized membrane protein
MNIRTGIVGLALALAACGGQEETSTLPGDIDDHQAFSAIGEGETVHFTGTEPFWGGEVAGSALTYTTPENIDGSRIEVSRFAGRGGLAFSGTLDGAAFDLLVSEGTCSDGMSDRSYPFTATLKLGEEQRLGCAWSDSHPFLGPENP